MSPEATIKLANWIVRINKELNAIDQEFQDVSELIRKMNDTQAHTLNVVDTILETLGVLFTRSQAQNARLTALENVVERFLGDNENSASELDSEVAEYNEDEDRSAGRWCEKCEKYGSHHTDRHDEFVGNSTGPHVHLDVTSKPLEPEPVKNGFAVNEFGDAVQIIDGRLINDGEWALLHIQRYFERA